MNAGHLHIQHLKIQNPLCARMLMREKVFRHDFIGYSLLSRLSQLLFHKISFLVLASTQVNFYSSDTQINTSFSPSNHDTLIYVYMCVCGFFLFVGCPLWVTLSVILMLLRTPEAPVELCLPANVAIHLRLMNNGYFPIVK